MTHPPKDASDALHPTLARLRAARSANRQPPSEPCAWLANLIANSGSVVTESSGGVPTPYTLSDNDREMICAALAPQDTGDAAAMLDAAEYCDARADDASDTEVGRQIAKAFRLAARTCRTAAFRPPAQGPEWNEASISSDLDELLFAYVEARGGLGEEEYKRRRPLFLASIRALTRPIQQSAGEADQSDDGLNGQARNPAGLPDGSGDPVTTGLIAGNDITDHHRQVGMPRQAAPAPEGGEKAWRKAPNRDEIADLIRSICSVPVNDAASGVLEAADAIIARVAKQPLSGDARRLVVAARRVAFECQDADALRELDLASEAFANDLEWDDTPSPSAALSGEEKRNG